MKKVLSSLLLFLSAFMFTNVYACGDLTSVNIDGATIRKDGDVSYIVGIKEDTRVVFIDAETDTTWVEGYGPREVSVNNEVKLVVDGSTCDHGDNEYYFTFEVVKPIIAETTETNRETTAAETRTQIAEAETTERKYTLELKSLEVENYNINFKPEKYDYELEVESEVTSIEIDTEKNNSTDSITVSANAYDLELGKNEVTVTVVSTNGERAIYTINVVRKSKLSSNNYAADIKISEYPLNFSPDIETYNVTIKNEKYLTINVVPENKNTSYEVLNNENLKNGSTITVKLTAEDGSTRNYTINVIKKFDVMAYWQYIAVSGLVVLLVVLLALRGKGKKAVKPNEISNTPVTPVAPTPSQTEVVNNVVPTAQPVIEGTNGLEFITPSNIEAPVVNNPAPQADEYAQTNPTEVFKL